MKYEELVEQVKEATKSTIVSKNVGHFSFQFNVQGEAEGAFYLEIEEGRINVEPYEYYDRNLLIFTTAEAIIQMLKGESQPLESYTSGKLKVIGDERLLRLLPFGSNCKM